MSRWPDAAFTIRREFVEDVSAASLDAALGRMGAALLVLHAPRDMTVGVENAQAIFTAAKHPKSFRIAGPCRPSMLSDANGCGLCRRCHRLLGQPLSDFARGRPDPDLPEGITRVSEDDRGRAAPDHFGRG